MKHFLLSLLLLLHAAKADSWGFFAHQKINYYGVFLLPPGMIGFYKSQIAFLSSHAVDPDKRRYAVPAEAPRHYIDLDHYGTLPYDSLPRRWDDAVAKFTEDSLLAHGIVPWHIQVIQGRLTRAFREKNLAGILKYSAEIGHYIGDAHVPLHASSNHNGQKTNQVGIHGFWESRVPELLAETTFDFFIGKAEYLSQPAQYIWQRVLESAAAADTVLLYEQQLTARFPANRKYAFEERNGVVVRQYSAAYTRAYNELLNGMVERRMRLSILSVASFWYTAWVDAGQPDLAGLAGRQPDAAAIKELDMLNEAWKKGKPNGRVCD